MVLVYSRQETDSGPKVSKFWKPGRTFSLIVVPSSLLCILAIFFYDVLFLPGEEVLSKEGADLFSQFVYYRDFGFSELRKGNLALWNPHIFSGLPFFGGLQSALLYPLNWVYLILPLAKAINVGIVLNLFLGGMSMYLWSAFRGLHPFASLFSAILFIFCGAQFLHIWAGHLPNLCTMTWVPLVLLAIDGLAKKPSIGWCLLGILAVTMQLLAGHPQYVFYTGVTSAVYAGLLMIKNEHRVKMALGFLAIYVGASALSAVQLMPGIQAAAESVRSEGLPYEFAQMFSFPPENFITLLTPGFFGDMVSVQYWGRCYLWEMSLFISIAGLALSIIGAISGERDVRRYSIVMVLILLVFSLGVHTPLFQFLYSFVPGFDKFRGSSKFIFFASLYLIMLAGIGFDYLIKTRRVHGKAMIYSLIAAVLLAGLAASIWYSVTRGGQTGVWARALFAVRESGESFLNGKLYVSSAFLKESGLFASKSLLISAGTCALLALIFFLTRFSKKLIYLVVFLAIAEILYFAMGFRPAFDLRSTRIPEIEELATEDKGDHRVLNLINPNSAMSLNMKDLWGYDPGVLRRYAQLMTYTQGGDPDEAIQFVRFSKYHNLYKMLRFRYAIVYSQGKMRIGKIEDQMPVAYLVDQYHVIQDRNRIFSEMMDPAFDPRKTVILEKRPDPEPVRSKEKGSVKVTDISTDQMIIEADVPVPTLLLITDTYSEGWRAKPLPGSTQRQYEIMPANYVIRAIPLRAGHHHFSLEYAPLGFRIGKWISLFSVILYASALLWFFFLYGGSSSPRDK